MSCSMIPITQKALLNFPPKGFIKLAQNKIKKSKIAHFHFNGVAKISAEVIPSGIKVHLNKHSLALRYPEEIWRRFPAHQKEIFAENIAYCLTLHLPFLFPTLRKMDYQMPVPLSEAFAYKSFTQALPATAMMQEDRFGKLTSNLLRRFFLTEYVFDNKKTLLPVFDRTSYKENLVMPFTFGKDSLLTFALCQELGISPQPVFIAEPHFPYDEVVKRSLAVNFQKENKVKIEFLSNTLGLLRDPDGWFGWETQLTQYSLMLLPYVYARKAAYLIFSNEQSCDETLIDADGFRCNPVFEQSHQWLLQNSLMASLVGGNSLQVGTFLEPIHEIAIIKILHHRYPAIGKYQSSCDLDTKPKSGTRWCEDCSKCARMYIFLLANGVDPKRVGFKNNMLKASKKHLFSLFDPNRIKEFSYDNTEGAHKEQLFAFLLAYKRGVKGAVMNSFAKRYLKLARANEDELRRTYFGVHSTTTIPRPYLSKLLRIFHEELDDLARP